MKKHLVKNGKKIKGFVWKDEYGKWWYAYGKPSQASYMSIGCRDLEHGIANVEMPMHNRLNG
jgi:hypothetical protein